MTDLYLGSSNRPYYAVATLIERHGLLRVLRAVAAAVLKPNRPHRAIAPKRLSPHLRRDLGLEPEAPRQRHWPPPRV